MTRFTPASLRSLVVLSALLCLASGSIASACPNCGEAMASDPTQAGLVRGIFWSILFLLSMPFLIFASIGGYFYWLVRRARTMTPSQAIADVPTGGPFATASTEMNERLEMVEA